MLLMTLLLLTCLLGARAQQTLPYAYGFEDNDLAIDGWTTVNESEGNATEFGISTDAKHEGDYGFRFSSYNNSSSYDQYLISPELSAATGVVVQFYYKASSTATEKFKVGYSTTDNEISSFTFGDEIVTSNTAWTQSEEFIFPAGTKYVAIYYCSEYQYRLYVDDFSFSLPPSCLKPTAVTVSDITNESAVVSWTSDADAWNLRYRIAGGSKWTIVDGINKGTEYPLDGLDTGTTYEVQVQTDCGGGSTSDWTNAVTFTTNFCAPVDQCLVNITLTDSYGDGWNGNQMQVVDVETGTILGTFTLTSGGTGSFTLNVCKGSTINFVYVESGSYSTENGWLITDVNDDVIAEREGCNSGCTPTAGVIATYTVSCSSCRKPANLTLAGTPAWNSATVTWDDNGQTNWQLCINDDEANLIDIEDNPSYTLTGLTAETTYSVKVRGNCGDGDVSLWSSAVTFTTDIQFAPPAALAANNITATSADVSWTANAAATGSELQYVKGNVYGSTLRYDDGTYATSIGSSSSSTQTWAVMYPGSMVTASKLTKVSWLETSYNTGNITVNIYQGGDDAPEGTPLYTEEVTPAGGNAFHELTLASPLSITPGKNLWIVLTETGLYVKSACVVNTPNNQWMYSADNGWYSLANTSLPDYGWMIRAEISDGMDEATASWTTVAPATSPTTITDLTPETTYTVRVKDVYAEGASAWVTSSFTTLEEVLTPSDLAVAEVAAKSAKLSWTENGTATAWEICLNDDETETVEADSNPFTLTGLTPETEYTVKVRAVDGEKKSNWSKAVTFTTDVEFHTPTDLTADNITHNAADISWTVETAATGSELQYAEGNVFGSLLRYDNDKYATSIGLGSSSTWTWGIMYPGSLVIGSQLTKISWYKNSNNIGDITISIYQGGDDAPEGTPLYTEVVTPTGGSGFHELTLASPVTITPGKNLWITLTTTGTYVMAACQSTETNNQWVINNGTWVNISSLAESLAGYGWMVRAEIGDGMNPSTVTWNTVADATSPQTLTDLTPNTDYTVRVKAIYGDGESEWVTTVFRTMSDNPVPYNIAADLAANGATLTWDGNGESYNVQYRTAASEEVVFFDGFDNGLGRWTIYKEGTGPFTDGWILDNDNGNYVASAWSYYNYNSYSADNWLITPQLTLGNTLTFRVKTESSYPDKYEVLLSTTGNSINDFNVSLKAMGDATGSWSEVSIDLSDHAGQQGYIAIHHVSTNQYYLYVDDFGVYGASTPAGAWQDMTVTDATATLSGLATNNGYEYQVQSVKDGETSEWSKVGEFALLTLDNDASDISSLLFNNVGKQAHVTLANRTLYKDNEWNTLCLPFDIADIDDSPLAGATVKTLFDATMTGTHVTLTFGEYPVYAGVPYIIKWDGGEDIKNPEFANVIISNAQGYTLSYSEDNVKFIGYYDAFPITAADENIYYMTSGSTLKHTGKDRTLKSCRAYFDFTESATTGREFVLDFGEGESTTGIFQMPEETKGSNAWYTIDGMKLNGEPTKKGVYINNGKQVIVK